MKSKTDISSVFRAKELFHKKMAKMPFEQKIKILIKLQKLANEIKAVTGRRRKKVWKI